MEKLLICDICGTSYADTEEKCPTCGYARAFDVETFYSERPTVPHTKVRGGRYSRKNVKKRLQGLTEQTMEKQEEVHKPVEQVEVEIPADVIAAEEENIQIPVEESIPTEEPAEIPVEEPVAVSEAEIIPEEEPAEISEQTAEAVQEEIEEAFPADPAVEAIEFLFPEEEPQEEEQAEELVLTIPEEIEFVEEAPQEPEKKTKGGNLWLNLALGFASVVFALSALYLVVAYAVPAVKQMLPAAAVTVTEASTTEPTAAPTEAEEVLVLNFTTLTFTQAKDSSKVFAIGLSDREIVWSSDDADVASVDEAGLITAVGPGTTTIRAVYGGQEAVVAVTCNFE